MSPAADLAKQAQKCIEAKEYQHSIELLTDALREIPTSIDYYIKRSTAYHYNKQYKEALKDAEAAVYLSHIKGKREQRGLAQMRRGITLFQLKQIENSFYAFEKAKEAIGNDNMLGSWLLKTQMALEKMEGEKKCTISEIPNLSELDISLQTEIAKLEDPVILEHSAERNLQNSPLKQKEKSFIPIIRHEWYQNDQTITIILYAKSVDKDTCKLELKEKSVLSVSFPLPNNKKSYTFQLPNLFDEVDVSLSTMTIFNSKIELQLKKRLPQKWPTLEVEKIDAQSFNSKDSTKINMYPSSSKYGSKDWDLLAKTMVTDNQETGDAALNKLFQDIYANADDDTKRAMMKSYIESNGTALSTNWKEVGAKKVEVQPPAGMEAKPWYH
ncbi:hypothetical protein PCANB_002473 [Pneumocystis canis]|nr:hypothetical protein PCK1_002486 [Pneumocystis canis]KAG5438753.1 hypothetical protein PCANB_002473 [Pneumocystis canis]